MAVVFPDFGPDDANASYAMRGLEAGGKLFKMVAGLSPDGTAVALNLNLYYLALTLALAGGLTFFLMPKMRETKNIVCWLIIVLVLIVGPYGNEVFFIKSSSTNTGIQNLLCPKDTAGNNVLDPSVAADCTSPSLAPDYFTPQVVAIDIASRIHRALYDAFFGPAGVLDNNITESGNAIMDFQSMEEFTISDRPDLQQEISLYNGLCSKEQGLSQLSRAPYVAKDKLSIIENGYAGSPVTLSEEESNTLKSKTFTMEDIIKAIRHVMNNYSGVRTQVYHPFAIYYDESDSTKPLSLTSVWDKNLPASTPSKTTVIQSAQELYTSTSAPTSVKGKTALEISDILSKNNKSLAPILAPLSDIQNRYVYGTLSGYHWQNVQDEDIASGYIDTFDDANSTMHQLKRNEMQRIYKTESTVESLQEQFSLVEKNNLNPLPVAIGLPRPNLFQSYKSLYADYTPARGNYGFFGEKEQPIPIYDTVVGPSSSLALTGNISILHNCEQFHRDLHDRMLRSMTQKANLPAELLTKLPNTSPFTSTKEYPKAPAPTTVKEDRSTSLLRGIYDAYINKAEFEKRASQMKQETALTPPTNIDDTYQEFVRKKILQTMLRAAFLKGDYSVKDFNPSDNLNNYAMNKQTEGENAIKNLRVGGRLLSAFTDKVSDLVVIVGSWFKGGEVQAYLRFLQIISSVAILIILTITPLLMLMALIIPSYAPGVLILSIGSIFIIKLIPAMFVVVDACMTIVNNMMASSNIYNNPVDRALMVFITATAYTGVVGATMWVLFKSGDANQLANIQQIDSAANKIADTASTITKGLAIAAGAIAIGQPGAMVAGARAGVKGAKDGERKWLAGAQGAIVGGFGQAKEVIGASGSNIPVLGQMLKEARPVSSAREAYGHVTAVNSFREEGTSQIMGAFKMSSARDQHQANEKYQKEADKAKLHRFVEDNPTLKAENEYIKEQKLRASMSESIESSKFTTSQGNITQNINGVEHNSTMDSAKDVVRDVLIKGALADLEASGVDVSKQAVKSKVVADLNQHVKDTFTDIELEKKILSPGQEGAPGKVYISERSARYEFDENGSFIDSTHSRGSQNAEITRIEMDVLPPKKYQELVKNIVAEFKEGGAAAHLDRNRTKKKKRED